MHVKFVDANVVLRYLLADVPSLFTRSPEILQNETVHLPFEVLAEVVYVLEKVYAVPRVEISASLGNLLRYPNISTNDAAVAFRALETYSGTSLDVVDSLLYAYRAVKGVEVVSFDRQLNKYLRIT